MTTPLWQPGHLYLPDDLVQPVSAPAPVNTALTNPGFESGVITGWTVTQTGGTGTASVATDKKFVGTYAGRWQGAAGSGFSGGVEAEWINATEAAIVPGRSVSATLYIALDDTSGSQNRAEVRLYWYDASHALLSHSSGTLIRGNNSSFFASTVTATAPAGAAYVRLGAWTTANASGGVRIDAASWSIVAVTTPTGLIYKATQTDPATSASTEPTWPTTVGATVVDGGVTWEGVQASRVEWTASPVMVTGATEPDWPTTVGASVSDGTIEWECISRRVEDENCPNTTARIIIASKVFATDGDIDRFCATANPLDWTSPNDAGYLPTGLQSANANDAAVLAQYRGNLISMNASSFQNWQVDPDPAAMALLDQMEGIGSTWQHAAQPVANDLFFLSKLGVRSVGISAGADNLAAGDIGMPIDVLVQAAMADAETYGTTPLATYYPSAGQYWLAFPETTQVACSVATAYNGGQAIPSITLVDLGTDTGSLLFRFATGGVPDRAEVYIGGVLVLDTGWWGDASHQAQLDTACTNLCLTSGTINPIPTPGITATQQWNNNEAIGFAIDKDTAETIATVKIYAPLDSTAWKFQLGCPGEVVDAIDLSGNAPNTSVGAAYSYTYATTGGTAPFTYYLAAGSLPDGLTLDAQTSEISGSATTVEAPTFTIGVIDANGLTDTLADQIAVLEVVDWYAVGTGGNGTYGVGTGGTDWTPALAQSDPGSGRTHFHVAASDTQVLLLDTAAGQVGNDADGWTDCTGLSAQTINGAIHDGTAFLVASNASVIQRSTSGVAFTPITAPDVSGFGQDNLTCISAKTGLAVACGYWPHTSADGGLAWLSPTTGYVFSGSEKVLALDNDGTQFIAVGENNRLASSTNGSSFTAITSPFAGTAHITACCNSGGVWVIGNASGQFAWSLTGASGTWTVSADTLGAEIKKICGYAGLFVAVGVGGKIMSSLGGASWTSRSNNFGTDTINDVAAYGSGA